MKDYVKCEICNAELSGEKCVFAIYEREIEGNKYHFCCENHADKFEKQLRKQEGNENPPKKA